MNRTTPRECDFHEAWIIEGIGQSIAHGQSSGEFHCSSRKRFRIQFTRQYKSTCLQSRIFLDLRNKEVGRGKKPLTTIR
jgi:hypothetical protein